MFRHSVWTAVFAAGVLSALGCVSANRQKDPLSLSADANRQLRPGEAMPRGGSDALPPPQLTSTPKPLKQASYDAAATGGSGVTKDNSFARTTPNNGGVIPPVKLPSPEIGGSGPFAPPVIAGASYGETLSEPGRSAGVRTADPLPPPALPSNPVASPKPAPPKLGPPEIEPPVTLTSGGGVMPISPPPPPAFVAPPPPAFVAPASPSIVAPAPPPLVSPTIQTPMSLPSVPSPTSVNVPLPAPAVAADLLPSPAVPVAPLPGVGAPTSPIPPNVIRSPVDEPIPGLPIPKLHAAEPIRPK